MAVTREVALHEELTELLTYLQDLMNEVRKSVDDGIGDNGDRG